jgi:hypothetical protein
VVIPLLELAVTALLLWGLWRALGPRPVFIVRIRDGQPHVTKGTVTQTFLREIADTCARHGVTSGVVRAVARDGRMVLAFSSGFPVPCQQQLRNLWALSGWPGGKRRERR